MSLEKAKDSTNSKKNSQKSKSCILGCLGITLLLLFIVIGTGFWGYSNRARIIKKFLPQITSKINPDTLPALVTHIGTEVQDGIPEAYLNSSYQITLPEKNGIIKISKSDKQAEIIREDFINYFKEQGWKIKHSVTEKNGQPIDSKFTREYPHSVNEIFDKIKKEVEILTLLEKNNDILFFTIMESQSDNYAITVSGINNMDIIQ